MATANELLANAKIAASKITAAKFPDPKAKTTKAAKAKAKTTTKAKTKAKTVKKTICPVCVNGRGEYANIAKHNKKHHGGRTPEVK